MHAVRFKSGKMAQLFRSYRFAPFGQRFPRYSQATIETPTHIPLEQRVAMHLTALDAALATLQDK